MSDKMPSRGFHGAVLKLLRAGDYQLTVTGRRELSPYYLRLSLCRRTADRSAVAPDDVDPDVVRRRRQAASARLHLGRPQSGGRHRRHRVRDARRGGHAVGPDARSGDTLEVTVLGSNFTLPEPPRGLCHRRRHCVAARDQLTADHHRRRPGPCVPGGRARRRQQLPVARSADVVWVDRKNSGEALVRRSARRRSTPPTTSAGWRATTESPARWPRSSARSTPSRASRSRRKRIGWPDRPRR